MIRIYTTGHAHNETVSRAFAAGLAGLGVDHAIEPAAPLKDGDAVFYGFLRGLLPTWRQAQAARRSWIYIDNGYFAPSNHAAGDYTGHYRATWCALQHAGIATSDSVSRGLVRLQRLGLAVRPARPGRHILVCPPGKVFADGIGLDAADWLNRTLARLDDATDRPVKVRAKGAAVPLAEDLADCHAVVTWGSAVAFAAALDGIAVHCDQRCAAFPVSWPYLADIDQAAAPDTGVRLAWAATLAANQWTLDEMRDGTCWRALARGM